MSLMVVIRRWKLDTPPGVSVLVLYPFATACDNVPEGSEGNVTDEDGPPGLGSSSLSAHFEPRASRNLWLQVITLL
jgi:hypothetical protein